MTSPWNRRMIDELRQSAADEEAKKTKSIETSDTDGFVSQWAHGISGDRDRLQAEILENGGTAEFLALFDRDGQYVPAEIRRSQYRGRYGSKGYYWALLSATGRITGTFITVGATKKLETFGLTERKASFPAEAFIDGEGYGLSGRAWAAARKTVDDLTPPVKE